MSRAHGPFTDRLAVARRCDGIFAIAPSRNTIARPILEVTERLPGRERLRVFVVSDHAGTVLGIQSANPDEENDVRLPFRRRARPAAISAAPAPDPTETPTATEPATLEAEQVMTAPEMLAPSPVPLAERPGRLAGSMRTQLGSSDLRAERLVRQLRGQLDELRERIDGRAVPEFLTRIDLAAVKADPEAAMELPAGLLVRALVMAHDDIVCLEERVADQRTKIGALSARIREIDAERAYNRGRTQTLDEVIAALHANLEDLRLQRDSARLLPISSAPRALRPSDQATVEALTGVEEA